MAPAQKCWYVLSGWTLKKRKIRFSIKWFFCLLWNSGVVINKNHFIGSGCIKILWSFGSSVTLAGRFRFSTGAKWNKLQLPGVTVSAEQVRLQKSRGYFGRCPEGATTPGAMTTWSSGSGALGSTLININGHPAGVAVDSLHSVGEWWPETGGSLRKQQAVAAAIITK